MAVTAQKELADELGVVRWSAKEALDVTLRYFPLRYVHPEMDLAVILEEAQQCLPKERQRSFAVRQQCYNTTARLNKVWEEYAAKNPEQAELFLKGREEFEQELRAEEEASAQAAKLPEPPRPETPSVIAEKVHTALESPTPPPAPVHIGPMELAMSAMIQRAVEGALGNLILEMKTTLDEQRDYIQSMINAQHDSLMGYFDEDFKRSREIQAEYISPSIAAGQSQLQQVRMRRKRVLIVTTHNQRGVQNAIESKFSGIDFQFVDGNQQRQVNAGGYYDLVLCNATNRPAVKDRLALLHGVKVVYTDGGNNSMIDIIRQKLGI